MLQGFCPGGNAERRFPSDLVIFQFPFTFIDFSHLFILYHFQRAHRRETFFFSLGILDGQWVHGGSQLALPHGTAGWTTDTATGTAAPPPAATSLMSGQRPGRVQPLTLTSLFSEPGVKMTGLLCCCLLPWSPQFK